MWHSKDVFLSFFLGLHVVQTVATRDLYLPLNGRAVTTESSIRLQLSTSSPSSSFASASSPPARPLSNYGSLSSSASGALSLQATASLNMPRYTNTSASSTVNQTAFLRIPVLTAALSSSLPSRSLPSVLSDIDSLINDLLGTTTSSTTTSTPSLTSSMNTTTPTSTPSMTPNATSTTSSSISSSSSSSTSQIAEPTSSPMTSEQKTDSSDLTNAQLAGAISGSILGSVAAVSAVFYLWHRRRRNQVARQERELEASMGFKTGHGSGGEVVGRLESAWLYDPPMTPSPRSPPPPPRPETVFLGGGNRWMRSDAITRAADVVPRRLGMIYEEEGNPFADELEGHDHVVSPLSPSSGSGGRFGDSSVWESVGMHSDERVAANDAFVPRPRSGTFELEDTQVAVVPGEAL